MNIGNKLYALRKEKNLSQEEVAFQLNVSRQTISKWETNQSIPDLDKIIPLCKLYQIQADELLIGTVDKKVEKVIDEKHEKAIAISISIFLYFLAIIWIAVVEPLEISENIMVAVFLLICGVSTSYLVYKMINLSNHSKKVNKYQSLDHFLSLVFATLYLGISFSTNAWNVTWIIWLIYALVIELLHLILELKEEKNGTKNSYHD